MKYKATMNLIGESLPAQGGEISFFGEAGGTQWCFNLDGDADNISGIAYGGNKELKVRLKRKG